MGVWSSPMTEDCAMLLMYFTIGCALGYSVGFFGAMAFDHWVYTPWERRKKLREADAHAKREARK